MLFFSVFFGFFYNIAPNADEMTFSFQEQKDMLDFYSTQKIRLVAELKHTESMLRKLNGGNVDKSSGVLLTRTGEKAKKRGPKSVWGKFILDVLKTANHPMLYNEIIQIALERNGLPASSHPKVRASILNSAFRLRAIQGRIATVGERGKKDKFIVLRNWLNDSGDVRSEDKAWLKEHHSFVPLPANIAEMNNPRYDEDLG